ncbi:DNA-directed RNA polymerase subunit beta' [Candidatus Poribacteria bacterium]|nr:MAG: DNA-directed RNA polymerase subunit beta' [Candidatus Poribacteria bacterium]
MNTAFDSISIKIASPEQIKEAAKETSCKRRNPADTTDGPFICEDYARGACSCGEVKKAETINYRSFRPEPEGLFCEAIFGPQKDWECNCGKYKRIKHKGMICDRCGVEITQQRVRRDRLGYIQLAAPVSHIWYFKGLPSRIGVFCGLSSRDVERVLYFEGFIVVEVTDPECPLEVGQVLTEVEYVEHSNKHWGGFRAGTGAEVIHEILSDIDLEAKIEELTQELAETTSHQKKSKVAKQLKQMADFVDAGQRPEWMILDVIPVIPPDLRPLVPLEGGRFATSDLNDLYRRVINRNNRLRKLIQLRSPEVILRNEKRMLQEAVDAFFDNGRHGRRVTGPGNRPLKSLAEVLKGKIGRFRQNLLGKRVDYSGRSVIVVGPELGLHQCGIPKRMAVELFKPFIIERLQAYGFTQTIKRAKHIAEHVDSDSPVWEVVEEVIADHPVLLNRPPTLHRLGIQAFLPVLVEGKSIRIPPLVCKAFNADFDGDQMAVHVPLTVEAQAEAKLLMLSSHNILKPSHGRPIAVPELDMVLGPSFLTKTLPGHAEDAALLHEAYTTGDAAAFEVFQDKPWYHRRFAHPEEVITAHAAGQLKLHDSIQLFCTSNGHDGIETGTEPILTTVGRVIFNEVLPSELTWEDEHSQQLIPFFNAEAGGRELSTIIEDCFRELGTRVTTEVLEKVQKLAFEYATLSGISPGIADYITPDNRNELVNTAKAEIEDLLEGALTTEHEEYENEQIRIWLNAKDKIEGEMFETLPQIETSLVERGDPRRVHPYVDSDGAEIRDKTVEGFSPVHIMADSGARARKDPFMQISAFVGLKAKQDGDILIPPIGTSTQREGGFLCSYREGLDVLDYFNSTYGSRKGLVDTALKTASSGYLTRRLVDVAQDVRVTMEDCGTLNGIQKFATKGGDLAFKISGRTAVEDIVHPETGNVLVSAGEVIDSQRADQIEELTNQFVSGNISVESRLGTAAVGRNSNSEHTVDDLNSGLKVVTVRSVLTCQADEGVCAKCYGNDLTTNSLVNVGEAVGIIAAQSIGEPGTQLTMRTFHTGGAVEDVSEARQQIIESKANGTGRFRDFLPGRTVKKEGELWISTGKWIDPDGPEHKVQQVNHPDCQLRENELLSGKQYDDNKRRYKGFDTKTWQYEVTAVLDSNCRLKVGDQLSQAEYTKALGDYGFKRFVKLHYRVTQVQHPDISVAVGDLLTEEKVKQLKDKVGQGFDVELYYLNPETDELVKEEDLKETSNTPPEQPNAAADDEEGDVGFKRVYRVIDVGKEAQKSFPFKVGQEVPAEEMTPWLTPFEVDPKPIYVVNEEIPGGSSLLEQSTLPSDSEQSDAAPLKAEHQLNASEYERACTVYRDNGWAFKVEKQEVERHRITKVYHPESPLVAGLDVLTTKEMVEQENQKTLDIDEKLTYRVTRVYHPDCHLERGNLLIGSEIMNLGIDYPAFAATASDFEVEQLYRVSAVNHPDLPQKVGDLLTRKKASEYRQYNGFDIETYYKVAHVGDKTTPVTVGQYLTDIEYNKLQEKGAELKVWQQYRVIKGHHPEMKSKEGEFLTASEYRQYQQSFTGISIERVYRVITDKRETDTPFTAGQIVTEEQLRGVQDEKRGAKYTVVKVYHPDCPYKVKDVLSEDEYFESITRHFGFEMKKLTLEDEHKQFQGFDSQELKCRVTQVYHPGCPLKEYNPDHPPKPENFLAKNEPEQYHRDYPGFTTSTSEIDTGGFETKRLYRVTAVNHPDCPLEVDKLLTQQEATAERKQYKGLEVARHYEVTNVEDGTTAVSVGDRLTESEYKALRKKDPKIVEKVTSVYVYEVISVHHPELKRELEAGTELTDPDYKAHNRKFKGFDTELVYEIVKDNRDTDTPLEPGTILPSKKYRALEKSGKKVSHTVRAVYHPNCKYAEGDELSEKEYAEARAKFPGFEVDELFFQMRIEVETSDGPRPHVIPADYSLSLAEGDTIRQGETLAELHERTANLDIVAGIPRVTDLFEARRLKRGDAAQIAEIEGYIRSAGTKAGVPAYRIEHEGYESRQIYQIPDEKRRVAEGDWVNAGEPLTDGFLNPHDILSIGRTTIEGVPVEGEEAVWAYLVDEIQKVYGKGTIKDKHIEVIVRQMLTKIRITEPGNTDFYPNDEVPRKRFERINSEIEAEGGTPATGEPILQSISKASLSTDSFISAASFQQTTKVLTDAAVSGQTDKLFGLKENVILGRLIPAGSGFSSFQNMEVSPQKQQEEVSNDEEQIESEAQGVYLSDGSSAISPTDVGDTVVVLDDE